MGCEKGKDNEKDEYGTSSSGGDDEKVKNQKEASFEGNWLLHGLKFLASARFCYHWGGGGSGCLQSVWRRDLTVVSLDGRAFDCSREK